MHHKVIYESKNSCGSTWCWWLACFRFKFIELNRTHLSHYFSIFFIIHEVAPASYFPPKLLILINLFKSSSSESEFWPLISFITSIFVWRRFDGWKTTLLQVTGFLCQKYAQSNWLKSIIKQEPISCRDDNAKAAGSDCELFSASKHVFSRGRVSI